MKRVISLIIVLAVVTWSVPCFAHPGERFRGGFRDVVTAPMQVSDNVRTETTNARFLPFAITGGFLKGCFYMVKQIVTGTMTMATAPVDMMQK